MLTEPGNQFSLTRAALSTYGRAKTKLLSVPEAAQNRAMQFKSRTMSLGLCSALALGATVAALGQPVITSFSANGVLACSNLAPGSVAVVEWASSVTGPWTNNWAGLEAVTADANGKIQVSVPMFYRVRGTNSVPSGMALIPAGPFVMGDTFDEGNSDELPLHTNQVSAFYLDKFEVTKALWDGVHNWAITNGYLFDYEAQGKATNHPAHSMPWYDAVKWCNARSEKEGRTPAYYTDAGQTLVYRTGQTSVQNAWVKWSSGYRLPTEAEWEKAARGGVSGHRFPWSDSDNIDWSRANYYAWPGPDGGWPFDVNGANGWNPAWTDGGDFRYTSPAGYFAANGYGLYDMAGNVWEWCWDWHDGTYYTSSPGTDPRGPVSGSNRVLRGGCWIYDAIACRAATRFPDSPGFGYHSIGFRSALPSGQ